MWEIIILAVAIGFELDIDQNQVALDDLLVEITEQEELVAKAEASVQRVTDEFIQAKKDVSKSWDNFSKLTEVETKLNETQRFLSEQKEILEELLIQKSQLLLKISESKKAQQVKETKELISNQEKMIGIKLSKACTTMLMNNFTTNCPNYQQLEILDTSDKSITGDFGWEDGFYKRLPSRYVNSQNWYAQYDFPIVVVDPPNNMEIPTITIENNFDNYYMEDVEPYGYEIEIITIKFANGTSYEKAIGNNPIKPIFNSRTIYHDRYVDECQKATINADKWELLLADTINYLRNRCDPSSTSFIEKEIIPFNSTSIDVRTSPNWMDIKYWESISNHCIFKFRECQ